VKLHQISGYIQSIYLVEYPDKLLLLDGCSRADVGLITKFITSTLKRPLTDLKLVVVSHMHPDHAGAAHQLRNLTQCEIASSNHEKQWYSGISGWLMHLTDILLTHWVAYRLNKPKRFIWYSRKLMPDFKLNDGDILPNFDEWQVLYTSGHTDRDISLHHLPSNRVYVADLMVYVKKNFIPPFPLFYPKRYLTSLAKIIELKPEKLLLAHGGEVKLSDEQYQNLLSSAPKVPLTHWRTVKIKFSNLLARINHLG